MTATPVRDLPPASLPVRRLRWWKEVLLILGLYAVYSSIRNANEGGASVAFEHAQQVMRWQEALHINFEEAVQDWALHVTPLVIFMNYVYGSLHFVVTAGVVVFLYRRHPREYPRWRYTLVATTILALVGFIAWPLMPPRLLPDRYGFVDTLARYPTLWSFDSGTLQDISNQYAAMPSLHFGWSLFCACVLVRRLRRPLARAAAAAYPVLTLAAIVLTGNHFILDAAGGAAVFGLAYGLVAAVARVRPRPSEPFAVPDPQMT